jgi:CRP-like cAMP-binding protein
MPTDSPLSNSGNILLATLSPQHAELLAPELESFDIGHRHKLELPRRPIKHVYFPTDGVASTVAEAGSGRRIEVCLFGRDGMSGQVVVMGNDLAPHSCFMQIEGGGLRMSADALRRCMEDAPGIRIFFLRYFQSVSLQTSHTALANGMARLEERLSRWLLMTHDRVSGDELTLTHEFISVMLGVRRAGVTVALNLLEGRGLVEASRGVIKVVDRPGLEEAAGRSYGPPEDEYERLIGVRLRKG